MPIALDRLHGDQKDVVINSAIDVVLFLSALLFAANLSLVAHIVRILFVIRIADYSSLRGKKRWSIFNVDLPRNRREVNADRDLILFSAYRILGNVWLVTGIILATCFVFLPASSYCGFISKRSGAIAIVIWAFLVFTSHLPKRMLLWHGEA
jgi:hypothetical protein